jgi:hypothetical protein
MVSSISLLWTRSNLRSRYLDKGLSDMFNHQAPGRVRVISCWIGVFLPRYHSMSSRDWMHRLDGRAEKSGEDIRTVTI